MKKIYSCYSSHFIVSFIHWKYFNISLYHVKPKAYYKCILRTCFLLHYIKWSTVQVFILFPTLINFIFIEKMSFRKFQTKFFLFIGHSEWNPCIIKRSCINHRIFKEHFKFSTITFQWILEISAHVKRKYSPERLIKSICSFENASKLFWLNFYLWIFHE